jgi:hypothetical protein
MLYTQVLSDIAASCCSPFSRERTTPLVVLPTLEKTYKLIVKSRLVFCCFVY